MSIAVTTLAEAMMTAFLVLLGAAVSNRMLSRRAVALVVGSTVAVLIWAGGQYTGASFNPARNFAPAVFAGEWHLQGLYLFAPLVGAALAAALVRVRATS